MEQDKAVSGGYDWTDYCIHQHHLETAERYTSSMCETRLYSRQFYATNPVPVAPPIQKVQSSAQASASGFSLKVGNKYLQKLINEDVNGEGLGAYNWATGCPLERLAANGCVWLGLKLPAVPEGMEVVSSADMMRGTVAPPCWFYLKASDVLDWVEKDGDIRKGQFERVMYKATYSERNAVTGFTDIVDAVVLYTEEEIITYNHTGRKVLAQEPNTLGFVPIVRADVGDSLIAEGVQYSKIAVELDSQSTQNMRDGYFNIIVARGFQMMEQDQDGNMRAVTISSNKIVQTPESDKYLEFVSPDATPEVETREKIKALQSQLDSSVQQAHSNFSQSGATLGSGVAYKEIGSYQAASVKFVMDTLLEKFRVTVYYAQKALGFEGEILMSNPEDYQFENEGDKLDQAETLDALSQTARSKDSEKAINALKIKKLFADASMREELIKADNVAIDASQPVPEFNG